MKELKRPQIKLPEAKVPGFLSDLAGDLRDRHLLPLVGLLLVAIVVVPFALSSSGQSDSSDKSPGVAASDVATGSASAGQRVTAFANSVTGLRDYRRRLHDLSAKDPFKQQYADSAADGSGTAPASSGSLPPAGSAAAVSTGATGLPATPAGIPGGGGSGGGGGNSGDSTVKVKTRYASYEIDVRIVGAGSGDGGTASSAHASAKGGVRVRRGVPELTMLPDRRHPAAVFMGVSSDSK